MYNNFIDDLIVNKARGEISSSARLEVPDPNGLLSRPAQEKLRASLSPLETLAVMNISIKVDLLKDGNEKTTTINDLLSYIASSKHKQNCIKKYNQDIWNYSEEEITKFGNDGLTFFENIAAQEQTQTPGEILETPTE